MAFHCIGRAGLQVHLHNSVNVIFLNELFEQFHAKAVGRHDGAADIQVSGRNRPYDIVIVGIHHLIRSLYAGAVFKAYHRTAVGFYCLYGFAKHAAYGAAGDEYALCAVRHRPFTAVVCLLYVVAERFQLIDALLRLEYEARTLQRLVHIQTHGGRRRLFLQLHQPHALRSLLVAHHGGPSQGIVGYLHAEAFLEKRLEAAPLRRPFRKRAFPLALGEMQNIGGANIVKKLVHLLFAVAGGFAHYKVGKISVRAFVRHRKAVAGFYQRTKVLGQVRLRCGYSLATHAAQAHRGKACRIHYLKGRKGAKYTGNLSSRFLNFFYFQESIFTRFAEFGEFFRKFCWHCYSSRVAGRTGPKIMKTLI